MIRICIIIVNWNGIKWLDKCLSSIIAQEFSEEYEIIFVDNGSTDSSLEYVQKNFPKIKAIPLDKNYGFAEANNIGVLNAKGEYLVFINTDTQVERNWLRNLVDAADQNPDYQILCSRQLPWMENRNLTLGRFLEVRLTNAKTSKEIVESLFASGTCFLLRRKWLYRVGYLFDPSYFCFSEDVDLSLRTILAGGKICYVNNSILWHFVGGSNYNQFWVGRLDMLNTLRNFQKLFSKGNYRKALLNRSIFLIFMFTTRPSNIRLNMGNLTGFIDFLLYRSNFLKKDQALITRKIFDEKKLFENLEFKGYLGLSGEASRLNRTFKRLKKPIECMW